MKKTLLTIITVMFLIGGAVAAGNRVPKPSTLSVLANPSEHDGKEVTLQGFLVDGMEYEHVLFMDKNAYLNELYDRAIGVAFSRNADALVKKHKCSYVMVTGRYSATDGVVGVGQLVSITRMLPISRDTCGADVSQTSK